mgnify:CR=1 FL=1
MFSELPNKSSFVKLLNFITWETGYFLPIGLIAFVTIEWIGRNNNHTLEKLFWNSKKVIRVGFYYAVVLLVIYFGNKSDTFIYFQF